MLSHAKYFKYLNLAIYTVYARGDVQIYGEVTFICGQAIIGSSLDSMGKEHFSYHTRKVIQTYPSAHHLQIRRN